MCECTTMVTSGLQPSQRGYCFFPTLRFRSALGWIISPFQGCFSIVNCQWLFVWYMIRRVPRITINHCPKGLKARIISAPSRKGRGIDIRTLFGGLKAWMKFILIFSIAESGIKEMKHIFDPFIFVFVPQSCGKRITRKWKECYIRVTLLQRINL